MGQDNVEYGMLDSGDEDAKEDVVSDTESDFDDTASVASGIDGSEPGKKDQDAMDHLLAKDFLREFGGSDAVLAGPTPEVLLRSDSPMALFFYFMPVALWQHIAICSKNYRRDMPTTRADEQAAQEEVPCKPDHEEENTASHLPRITRRGANQAP
ncbi:hypothetical protein PC110_g20518 [Phytophthora cactorum]|uniref:Uncharacterized protein n=1 Tax=Phytophthora cactorum TaxID=29920 RepID=A0A329RH25_9STRA|nr:hypothetical protein PC110_g20518 [Phytophthora cactorum]